MECKRYNDLVDSWRPLLFGTEVIIIMLNIAEQIYLILILIIIIIINSIKIKIKLNII